MNLRSWGAGFVMGAVLFTCLSIAIAWTGPTQAPPNGNVAAPLNTGTANQVKNAGLSVDSLAVFGNSILNGASRYLNFGTTVGASGYGIRDNAGVMQFRNSTGSWQNLLATSSVFQAVTFADGTTQTTAAGTASLNQTYRSCAITTNVYQGVANLVGYTCTTPACPSGHVRSGCGNDGPTGSNAIRTDTPSGTGACTCNSNIYGGGSTAHCYTYCIAI